MPLKITISLYSGRPNPTFILPNAQARTLLNRLSIGSFKRITEDSEPFPSMLGYRGFTLEWIGKRIPSGLSQKIHFTLDYAYSERGIAESGDLPVIESFAMDHLDSFEMPKTMKLLKKKISKKKLKKKMDDFHAKCPKWKKGHKKWYPKILRDAYRPIFKKPCMCAPLPDLDAWNADWNVTDNNNCYNYGTNYRTDTFAQPGAASGQQYNDLSACIVPAGNISAKMGALSDGLIDLPSNNNTCPGIGHLVALVVAPDEDYHWYRKGRNGKWSHKMGDSPATLLDSSSSPISDPRTADRGDYVDFCTFMQVTHGHFKII